MELRADMRRVGRLEGQQWRQQARSLPVVIVTRAVVFTDASFLFVNVDAVDGEMQVGVMVGHANGSQTRQVGTQELLRSEDCITVSGVNRTKLRIRWRSSAPNVLAELRSRPIHLRFVLWCCGLTDAARTREAQVGSNNFQTC